MKYLLKLLIVTPLLCLSSTATASLNYAEVLLSPENYVGTEVTMKGGFYWKNSERGSFQFQQGDYEIEVFYAKLAKASQMAILGEENFSQTPVTVTGVLKPYGNTRNSYYIDASKVEGLAPVKVASASGLQYTQIVLSPEDYIGTEVTMKGGFYWKNSERGSFQFQQGDDEIEVFYARLPKETKLAILQAENFSKSPVQVTGILKPYGNARNSYYIDASRVTFN